MICLLWFFPSYSFWPKFHKSRWKHLALGNVKCCSNTSSLRIKITGLFKLYIQNLFLSLPQLWNHSSICQQPKQIIFKNLWKHSPCCLPPLRVLSFTPTNLIKLCKQIMRNVLLIIIFCSKNKLHPLWWGIWGKMKLSSPEHQVFCSEQATI